MLNDSQESLFQHVAFKNLVKQNKELEAAKGGLAPNENAIVKLPFIVINTSHDTDIDCSITNDRKEYLFNLDKPFEVFDDVQILKKMGMCFGLENGTCPASLLPQVQSLLPESLHCHLEGRVCSLNAFNLWK